MSRVTAIISALVICIIVCSRGLLTTTITPLPTKPSATKCQRTEAGERGNYWHADASAWCWSGAWCKIHEGVSWCWCRKMMLPRDDVAAGRRRLHIKVVCRGQRGWSCTTASGVDNAASSPDWQTPLNGIISPWGERLITMQNNWKEPRSILMLVQIELPISMGNSCNYCDIVKHTSPVEYKCLK